MSGSENARLSYLQSISSLVLPLLFFLFGCGTTQRTLPETSVDTRPVLVVLGGFTGSDSDTANVVRWLGVHSGYRVLNGVFQTPNGIAACEDNLRSWLLTNRLDRVPHVDFFCFILGGMVLNEHIRRGSVVTIGRTVLDRGPIQEELPRTILRTVPWIAWAAGKTLTDIGAYQFDRLAFDPRRTAVIMETRPSSLASTFRSGYQSERPLDFTPSYLALVRDYMYIPLSHDDVYERIDQYGDEVLSFLSNSSFTKSANRRAADWSASFFHPERR